MIRSTLSSLFAAALLISPISAMAQNKLPLGVQSRNIVKEFCEKNKPGDVNCIGFYYGRYIGRLESDCNVHLSFNKKYNVSQIVQNIDKHRQICEAAVDHLFMEEAEIMTDVEDLLAYIDDKLLWYVSIVP